MKQHLSIAFASLLVIASYSAFTPLAASNQRRVAAPAVPAIGGVHEIVSAQPFLLDRGWRHVWRLEAPEFDAGWLLVLDVEPTLVEPRQMAEPVLFAGHETVERINHGFQSGRVVAILPSRRNALGGVGLDLATTPIFFGQPDLPERVDATRIERELVEARARGVRPLEVPTPLELLHLPSRDELDQRAGLLVLEHAAGESDTGTGLLAPRPK